MSRPRAAPLVDPATDTRRSVGLEIAAQFLGLSHVTLRRRIEDGIIPAYRDGKVYKIRVAALLRYQRTPRETIR
jgi:excisionase family DNA binding protein